MTNLTLESLLSLAVVKTDLNRVKILDLISRQNCDDALRLECVDDDLIRMWPSLSLESRLCIVIAIHRLSYLLDWKQ